MRRFDERAEMTDVAGIVAALFAALPVLYYAFTGNSSLLVLVSFLSGYLFFAYLSVKLLTDGDFLM